MTGLLAKLITFIAPVLTSVVMLVPTVAVVGIAWKDNSTKTQKPFLRFSVVWWNGSLCNSRLRTTPAMLASKIILAA